MGNLEKFDNKIHKLKYNISLLKSRKKTIEKSKNKKLRIERARKLLKLGILFEMTSTDIYPIELIIGYLLELREKKTYEIGTLKYYGNKILTEISIEKHDKKEILFLDTEEKRKRNHKLISLGALFEMTSTDNFSTELIIGYLLELKEKKIYEIGALKYYGNKILTENSIEKHDQRKVIFLDTDEKKRRNHKLISLGALFEMTSTDNFSIAVLISYLENLHSLKDRDFNLYQENGEIYLKNRRAKYGE